MTHEITRLNMENEMDLVLAHKRSIRLGEWLNLSISNQTTFTTAISECCREVIEKAGSGLLSICIVEEDQRYNLVATVRYKENSSGSTGRSTLDYARRLVTQLDVRSEGGVTIIELRMSIPRSARVNEAKIAQILEAFRKDYPDTPYEQVKLMKEELNKIATEQEEQLIRSRYINEKKTEFLSIASHELKTPLTTIKAFAQLAMNENDPEAVRMYLSKINTQSDKLYKLIQQLLDVSRIEGGRMDFNMEETSMNSYLHDTVSLVSKSMPSHRVMVETKQDVVARIDKLRLEQVISNILVNAAKYSKENTLIRVITAVLPDNQLRISIQDEGIGMSAANIKRVFEKFFRVEEISRTYSGLGMGLYIASRIVSGHNGRIWIDSEVDIGSTFHVAIPYLRPA